jgi:hypothetical protein
LKSATAPPGVERFFAVLTACFTAFAIILSGVGFYATLAYVVTLQRREIGIRFALGASASDVRRLIAGQGLSLASLGLVLVVVRRLRPVPAPALPALRNLSHRSRCLDLRPRDLRRRRLFGYPRSSTPRRGR